MCADGPVEVSEPPPIQDLPVGGALRFAVGRPDGPRSRVWSVIGATSGRDVYAGARETLGDVKLSFHPTWWRLAHTEPYADAHLPPGQDRLIRKWQPGPERVPGWRHALSIVVGSSLLGPPQPVSRPSSGTIAWWPDPGPDQMVSFKLLIGEPQRVALLVAPPVATVGTIAMSDGSLVQVTAEVGSSGAAFEAGVAEMRQKVTANPELGKDSYWAWNTGSDIPMMLDISGAAT